MFLGKEILGDFINFVDYNDPETIDLPMEKLKLITDAPQSAIDAFEKYKKLMEKMQDAGYE